MKERNKIKSVRQGALNDADRLELAKILVKAGYCVHIGKEKDGKSNTTVVEYWEDKQ